ncbi:MAG: ABC transporter substrate-binding protein [Roseinatronobacter sp.]
MLVNRTAGPRGPLLAATILGAGLIAAPVLAAEGDLVIALPTFSEQTMTPWDGSGQRKTYLDMIYEYLVYLDADGNAVPGLAEAWTASPDYKQWTFTIRQGVPFSGGHGDLTADDVKFSIERLISEDSRAGPASTMRRVIESVEAPDEQTVIVNLREPDFRLATGYFGQSQQLGIVSRAYIEEQDNPANALPVGTGPYVVERSVDGSEIVMRLRDDIDISTHWRAAPEFERVTFRSVPEEATRVAMLRTGEADIAPIGFDSIPGLTAAGLRVVSAAETWSPVVRLGGMVQTDPARFNPDNPWSDRRVRQAMNYAVDKQTIIDELFQGEGTVAPSDTPVREWDSVPPYPYDPDKARALLSDAGFPNGFEITLKTFTTTPGAELPLMAEAIALYWADVGINTTIEPIDWPSLRSEWTDGRATTYAWTHRGFPFADPVNGLEAGFTDRSLFASYTSEALEAKIAQMANEQDTELREQYLTEIGHYLRDEAAAVFMVLANEPYGVGQRVGDWSITTSYVYNFDAVGRSE